MSNYEKLKGNSEEEFWYEIRRLFNHPLARYIDYVSWLKSTEEDIVKFVTFIGRGRLLDFPEIKSEVLIVREYIEFNAKFYEVYVEETNRLIRIPAYSIAVEELKGA